MATNFVMLNDQLVEIEQTSFKYWETVWSSYVEDQTAYVKDKVNVGKNYTVDMFVMNWANAVGGAEKMPVTVGTVKANMSRMNAWAEKFGKRKFSTMRELRLAIDAANAAKRGDRVEAVKPVTSNVKLNHDAKFNADAIAAHLEGDKRALKALIKALEAKVA